MDNLVEIKKGTVFCDSKMVADKFGYQHQYVKKVIQKITTEFNQIKGIHLDTLTPLNFIEEEREYRGQKFTVFLMDRPTFSALSMRFTGIKALEWQLRFNDAFYKMEQQLILEISNKKDALWVTQREQGKLVRLTAMDTVKDFVDYATSQGSENAKFYYKHITVACYKCLQLIQHKKPSLRDTLDTLELSQLMLAEIVAERSIRKHMLENEHYKAIFVLVKQDLENFAKSLMIESKEIVKSRNK